MLKLKDLMIVRIAELSPEAYRMMTREQFAAIFGVPDDDAFSAALDELSTDDASPLEAWGMLFGHEEAIEDEDFAHFKRTGELIHPVFGYPVQDAANCVSVYYAVRVQQPPQPAL